MNILFTCAGRRTYLLKYFKEQLAGEGLVIAVDMQLSAPALSVADVKLQVPSLYSKDYVDVVLDICSKYNVRIVISLNDLELPILAGYKRRFEEVGVFLLISDSKVIDICFDKYKTYQYITSLGLKSPKTYKSYIEAQQAIADGSLSFPLVVKPRWGSGSIGVEFVLDEQELDATYTYLKKKVKRGLLSQVSEGDDYILIQEKIDGKEYGVDIMNDLHCNHWAVSVKQKLAMRAGETDKAITEDNPEIRNICSMLGKDLKHVGNLDCDILERNGEYYVLELNPRFGGGFPFSYEAGVNMPGAILKWLREEEVDPATLFPEYGKMFAKCDYLVELEQ